MILWVVMRAHRFDAAEYNSNIGFPGRVVTPVEPYWFLPMYETEAAAREAAGTRYQVFAVTSGEEAEP